MVGGADVGVVQRGTAARSVIDSGNKKGFSVTGLPVLEGKVADMM
jgi:hypothetical protein